MYSYKANAKGTHLDLLVVFVGAHLPHVVACVRNAAQVPLAGRLVPRALALQQLLVLLQRHEIISYALRLKPGIVDSVTLYVFFRVKRSICICK